MPWFPRQISELDSIASRAIVEDLEADHPGFSDKEYRARRNALCEIAFTYQIGEPIPIIDYTADEIACWGSIYSKLEESHKKFACKEYLNNFESMKTECGYSKTTIPQADDISRFLMKRTGFRLRPVSGLLSSRDFLSGLAFRVFFSTQYIRHSSKPLYTPEPDVCHELIGHAPMFADDDFASFSQEIGLASLGASDEEIKKLAACYWHSVEFGLLEESSRNDQTSGEYDSLQRTDVKAYGAGLLSSFGEIEYACDTSGGSSRQIFNPSVAAITGFPITEYQPVYFVARNLRDAKELMRKYCEEMPRPFYARYNTLTSSIWVDRAVKTSSRIANANGDKY